LQNLSKYIFTIVSTIYRYNLFIFSKINKITIWQCVRIGPVLSDRPHKNPHNGQHVAARPRRVGRTTQVGGHGEGLWSITDETTSVHSFNVSPPQI